MSVEMISVLKNDLKIYDLIVLVKNNTDDSLGGMIGRIQNSRAFRNSQKRILVLPADKYIELVTLYHTYEFSDRFRVIGKSVQHGELFNYVDSGLLTEEEVFELILK